MIDLSLHQYPYTMDAAQRQNLLVQPLAGTSTSPQPSPTAPIAAPEPAPTSFAFLVHSQDTIPNNLPPSVDNKPLARQRRRRTSPDDQAILEEEFLRDSKPDKAARSRIVERVALGEKEVQIWFQNRRQNSRRKSRPLLPHEILPLLQASRGSASSSSPTFCNPPSSEPALPLSEHKQSPPAESDSRSHVERSSPDSLLSATSATGTVLLLQANEPHHTLGIPATASSVDSGSPVESSHEGMLPSPSIEVKPTPRRRSPGTGKVLTVADLISSEPDIESSKPEVQSKMVEPTIKKDDIFSEAPVSSLKRTRSKVRLFMTSDGAARLLAGDESSPSPPRSELLSTPTSLRPNGLRRSYSAAGLNDSFSSGRSTEAGPGLRRIPSGRSRDSRAWEFWCDADARNELVKKADQEQRGSAAAAISLIRSNSRGPLTPNTTKANATLMRHTSVKRAKTEALLHDKPMLGRAKSSVARLQGESLRSPSLSSDRENEPRDKPSKTNTSMASPTGDSDKENWEPEVQPLVNGRGRLPQNRANTNMTRSILGESKAVPSQSSSGLSSFLHGNSNGIREGAGDKENIDPEKDEEIASFMGKGRQAPAPARVARDDDMDCIQGLLSLSQGLWR